MSDTAGKVCTTLNCVKMIPGEKFLQNYFPWLQRFFNLGGCTNSKILHRQSHAKPQLHGKLKSH